MGRPPVLDQNGELEGFQSFIEFLIPTYLGTSHTPTMIHIATIQSPPNGLKLPEVYVSVNRIERRPFPRCHGSEPRVLKDPLRIRVAEF